MRGIPLFFSLRPEKFLLLGLLFVADFLELFGVIDDFWREEHEEVRSGVALAAIVEKVAQNWDR
jgi:hypothetical protein